ncbi:SGNH/GDSL hydrolase family protein [Actinoplanes sp. URMC 104]|uniref:SGNH/GDSL hydrolase family protein n=1 Tax=Actinoplanes sp. URMC 104 TaxID=3423409 RepID=UPI003F1D2B01
MRDIWKKLAAGVCAVFGAGLLYAAVPSADAAVAASSWTPAELFKAAAPTNPFPGGQPNGGVWRLAEGNGFDTGGYRALNSYTGANCGIGGYRVFSDPSGLPLVGWNGSGRDITNEAGTCATPFTIPAGAVVVHPMAADAVIEWTSPVDGTVDVTGRLWDADTSCGNGVGWKLAVIPLGAGPVTTLTSGSFGNGGTSTIDAVAAAGQAVARGSRIILVVDDAGDTTCDLTNVDLTVRSSPGRYAYVAMGDSYSSGEGSPENTFYRDTVVPDQKTGGSTGCHRSSKAWATNIAATRKLTGNQWKFAACSGSVLNDFFAANHANPAEAPQTSFLSSDTKLVTMTIGGNDVGFSTIVKDCIFDELRQKGQPGCRQSGRVANTTAEDGLRKLRETKPIGGQQLNRLAEAYLYVATHIAPDGKVIVAQYPRLFASGAAFYRAFPLRNTASCQVGTAHFAASRAALPDRIYVAKADADYLNGVLDRGNAIIADGVKQANDALKAQGRSAQVVLADGVNKQFDSDRVCDAGAHINGVILHGLQKGGNAQNQHPDPDQRSFHPNTDGQSDYARAVKAKLG